MLSRSIRQLCPAEHARHFFGALFAHDGADAGPRATGFLFFFDHIVVVGKGGDLGQVGYAEHLIGAGQRF